MKSRFNTNETPTAPQEISHAPSCEVADLFGRDLTLNALPLVGNAFSQTPGDPFRLSAGNVEYYRASQELMHGRLYDQAIQAGILPQPLTKKDVIEPGHYDVPEHHHKLIDFIQQEIDIQHTRRCVASSRATERLLKHFEADDVQYVANDEAELIWCYLTGQIQPSEAALLLMEHPEMLSVEAAKRTMPFKDEAMNELDSYAFREFLMLRSKLAQRDIDARITFADAEKQPMTSIRQYSEDQTMCMVVAKQTVAEIKAPDYPTIQLKRKKAMVGISPELQIPGLTPDVKLIDKRPFSLQFVGGSYYLCVKKEEIPDEQSGIDRAV